MKWFKGLIALLPTSALVLVIGVVPTMWIDKYMLNISSIILPSFAISGLWYQFALGFCMLLIDFYAVCLVVHNSKIKSYILLGVAVLMHSIGIYFTFVFSIPIVALLCAVVGVASLAIIYLDRSNKNIFLDIILVIILIYYLYAFSLAYTIFMIN